MANTWAQVWELRASLYGFFANSLLKPIKDENKVALTQAFWNEFPLESANSQMESGLEQLKNCLASLEELSEEKAIEEVMVEYTSLFLGPGRPAAPPYESFYRNDQRLFFGQPTFEMKEILNRNGLESKRKDKQPEDHIGLELLFISAITEQLQQLEFDQQVSIAQEQISFIDEHLLSWIPDLCKDAKECGTVGFYGALFELIWGVLLLDRELLDEFIRTSGQVNEEKLQEELTSF